MSLVVESQWAHGLAGGSVSVIVKWLQLPQAETQDQASDLFRFSAIRSDAKSESDGKSEAKAHSCSPDGRAPSDISQLVWTLTVQLPQAMSPGLWKLHVDCGYFGHGNVQLVVETKDSFVSRWATIGFNCKGVQLGAGCNGVVYEATATKRRQRVQIKDLVALKFVRKQDLDAEAKRFLAVTHDACVKLFDYFDYFNEDELLHEQYPLGVLAFERCESTLEAFLGDRIARQLPCSDDEVRTLLVRLCQGLQTVSLSGLVHGDLAVRNVFLRETGKLEKAVLADFGCAVSLEIDGKAEAKKDNSPSSAPELEQQGRVSSASDVFSVGVIAVSFMLLLDQRQAAALVKEAHVNDGVIARLYQRDNCETLSDALLKRAVPADVKGLGNATREPDLQLVNTVLAMVDREPGTRISAAGVIDVLGPAQPFLGQTAVLFSYLSCGVLADASVAELVARKLPMDRLFGRDFIKSELQLWVRDGKESVFLLTADAGISVAPLCGSQNVPLLAGMGKSALVVELRHTLKLAQIDVLPWFCFFDNAKSRSISAFVRAIGQAARQLLPDYHRQLSRSVCEDLRQTMVDETGKECDCVDLPTAKAIELFSKEVLIRVKAIAKRTMRPCVLLLDSLDESLVVEQQPADGKTESKGEKKAGLSIAELLVHAEIFKLFDQDLRLVVTSRPDAAVLKLFSEKDCVRKFSFEGDKHNQADITSYCFQQILASPVLYQAACQKFLPKTPASPGKPAQAVELTWDERRKCVERAAESVAKRAGYNFLAASCVVECEARSAGPFSGILGEKDGLAYAFRLVVEGLRGRGDRWLSWLHSVCGIVQALERPPPLSSVFEPLMKLVHPDLDVPAEELAGLLAPFVTISSGTVSLRHRSISEWILTRQSMFDSAEEKDFRSRFFPSFRLEVLCCLFPLSPFQAVHGSSRGAWKQSAGGHADLLKRAGVKAPSLKEAWKSLVFDLLGYWPDAVWLYQSNWRKDSASLALGRLNHLKNRAEKEELAEFKALAALCEFCGSTMNLS